MKKGNKVTLVIVTPVATVEEVGVIEKVKGNEIFIEGLDIPFDKKSGVKTYSFPGTSTYIKELKK
jgi:hypothetical protein